MEIYGLIFLIVVGVLYGVSIRIVSVQGYDEMLLGHSFGDTPQAYIPNIYSLPSILAGLIVVGWFWLLPDPYEPIRQLTSHTPAGWVWTCLVAYVVCIPFGLNLGSVVVFARVRPESKLMRRLEFIMLYASWIILGIILFHVYNPWLIWIPMMFSMPLTFIIQKELPRGVGRSRTNTVTYTYTSTSTSRRSSSNSAPYPSPSTSHRSSSGSQSSSSSSRSDDYERAHMRDEYYSQYQYYQDRAERLLSEAESYDRSADDNEYWAREANNSFKAAEARNDRNRASRLRYESREARRQADRYYDLYRQYSR